MLTGLWGIGPPIAVATKDGQRRIPRKSLVGERQLAEVELRPARAPYDAGMGAVGAKPDSRVPRLPRPARIVHHESMFISEALTLGVRIRVQSEYSADQSAPAKNQWFFLYTVTISNEGSETVQLLTRHWIITDGTGHIEEVRGPGVVGKQPTIKPGESFEYTSGCPLSTPFGVMEGTYQMVTQSGDRFDAKIAPFTLSEPYTVH